MKKEYKKKKVLIWTADMQYIIEAQKMEIQAAHDSDIWDIKYEKNHIIENSKYIRHSGNVSYTNVMKIRNENYPSLCSNNNLHWWSSCGFLLSNFNDSKRKTLIMEDCNALIWEKKKGEFSDENHECDMGNERGNRLVKFSECERMFIINSFSRKATQKMDMEKCVWSNKRNRMYHDNRQKSSYWG